MYLSRELKGQRMFTFGDKVHLKMRLKVLDTRLRSGVNSAYHKGILYRIKIDRVVEGEYNSIIVEFMYQSGNRVRYLFCNGMYETDVKVFSLNYSVRPDRVLDLSAYKTWGEVKKLIIQGLIHAEDSRYNADFYRNRVEM